MFSGLRALASQGLAFQFTVIFSRKPIIGSIVIGIHRVMVNLYTNIKEDAANSPLVEFCGAPFEVAINTCLLMDS